MADGLEGRERLRKYIGAAVGKAHYEILKDDGTFYAMRPEFLLAAKELLHNRFEVNGSGSSPFSAMLDVGSCGVGPAHVAQLPRVAQES